MNQPRGIPLQRRLSLLAAIFLASLVVNSRADESATNNPPAYAPTDAYRDRQIEGWRVRVNTNLLADAKLCDRTLKLLGAQLYQITRVVPTEAVAKLRQIPIWVELSSKQFPCMCYHESRDWLNEHGVNPDKTGGVELANSRTFLTWTREQPWMVLHELAHGYHQQFLGDDNARIRQCYEHAKEKKLYDSVLRSNGHRERHYAMTNPKEYFAEATEAFFGVNDFYPFVRAELKEHDAEMFDVLREVWGVTASTGAD